MRCIRGTLAVVVLSGLLCGVPAALGQAGTMRLERVENETGPSHNTIHAVTQDRQGFIWIGTGDGLNRYDGYDFVVYRHDPSDTTSLVSNSVRALLEDRSGRLWVGTQDGIDRLDQARGVFRHYTLDDETETGEPLVDLVLHEAGNGQVWVGTNRGLFRYEADADHFRLVGSAHGSAYALAADSVLALQEDARGRLWVLTTNEQQRCCVLHHLNTQTRSVRTVDAPNPLTKPFLIDHTGTFWLGDTSLGTVDAGTTRFTSPPARLALPALPWTMIEDQKRQGLWVGSFDGLYRYDLATRGLMHHPVDPSNPEALQEQVSALFEDRSGALWVGTWAGLYRYDPQAKPFAQWRHDATNPNSLSSNVVMAIHEDEEGLLWLGTYGGGLNRLDRATGRVVRYDVEGPPQGICDDVVKAIHEDDAGRLWLATGEELCSFDRRTERFTRHTLSLPSGGVWSITTAGAGRLWLGTLDGAYQYDPDTGRARLAYERATPAGQDLPGEEALYPENDSIVWIGTSRGMFYRVNVDEAKRAAYPIQVRGQAVQAHIWTIHRSAEGDFWLGSSAGLSRFDPRTRAYTHYSERDGLPGSIVYSILEDDQERLWLGTNQGLARFDPPRPVRAFTQRDGVGSTEFNRRAAFRSRQGAFFFGGLDGLTMFQPDAIQDHSYVPPVALTRIQAANREGTATINPFGLDELVLSYRDYFFSFEFAALSFTNARRNQYAYRLDGFDEGWVEAGTRRFAGYTNIPPGDYVFRVKGSNSDGVWNEEGTAIRLTITPPFWQTTWFRGAAFLLLAGLLGAGYRYRIRRLLERERVHNLAEEKQRSDEEARRLAELDAAKSRFFANVSHEFRTPLTLILGVADRLEATEAHPIRRNARRLLGLIDQLLDLSRLEAGKLTLAPHPGDLVAHLRALTHSFAPLAERKQITLSFRTDHHTLSAAFDHEKVAAIAGNLLSNALKFTPEGGKVLVTLSERMDTVAYGRRTDVQEETPSPRTWAEIVVKDTGPGIPKAALPRIFDRFEQVNSATPRGEQSGTGIGLALAKELTELHGGTILVESEVGFGSAFIVHIPFSGEKGIFRVPTESKEKETPRDTYAATDGEGRRYDEANPISSLDTPASDPFRILGAPKILLVEDNAEVRALVRGYLEGDYQVVEAADGMEGLAMARTHGPDLVLSDVMMPKMDGVALCRALKNDDVLRTVPVVLLTAKASDEAAVEGLEAGADDYVTKPFHAAVLQAKLANLIAVRRQMRDRFSKELVVQPAAVVVSSEEEAFLQSVLATVEDQMGDSTFGVEGLADAVALSRRQLERRLKETTGQTPAELIRQMRLERASALLKAESASVSEIAYAVGFRSANYFSTAFREAFGHAPSEHFDTAT